MDRDFNRDVVNELYLFVSRACALGLYAMAISDIADCYCIYVCCAIIASTAAVFVIKWLLFDGRVVKRWNINYDFIIGKYTTSIIQSNTALHV